MAAHSTRGVCFRALLGRTFTTLAVITASLVVVVGSTNPAHAQFRFGAAGTGQTKVTPEDVTIYAKVLGLTSEQKQAADALHAAYLADVEKADTDRNEAMRKIREEFEDTRDPSIWQNKMPDLMRKQVEKSKEMQASFLNDLKTMLTPEQAAKWPVLERTSRRRQATQSGMLAGEAVDLVAIVDQLKLAKSPEALADTLERYSGELDAALQERNRQREEIGKQMEGFGRNAGGGLPDFAGLQKSMNDLRKAGVKTRDINDRYSNMLKSSIPADKQADFESKVKLARFPQVYNETHTAKSLVAAAAFKDLDEKQKSGIAEVKASYERDIVAANEKLAQEISKAEADGGGDDSFNWFNRMNGGGDQGESDLTKARKARREIDRAALDKLKALLSESQVERLPERQDDQNRTFGGPRRSGR